MLQIERIQADIDALSDVILEKHNNLRDGIQIAQRWLEDAPMPSELRAHLAPVIAGELTWEGALPVTDMPVNVRLTSSAHPQPGTTLIAVDGSQIFPDRHAAVLYYLIQVGAMIFRYNHSTPSLHAQASLHFRDQEIYDDYGHIISVERIGIQRLVREMSYLADLSVAERQAQSDVMCFALTDGPLLWPYSERRKVDHPAFQAYLEALVHMRQYDIVPVGYVERPTGRAVLDLLWLGQLPLADVLNNLHNNPLRTLTDDVLMAHVLSPGERSVWFKRCSATNERHAGSGAGQEIWSYYANMGELARPVIARVDVPAWAAEDETLMIELHAALQHQARTLRGYPYVLARAHEQALVTTRDKAALDVLIQQKLIEQGTLARLSEKARQKSYLGRR